MRPARSDSSASLDAALVQFGREMVRKLRAGAGSPEDHLRGPFERLLTTFARGQGLDVTTLGETRLPDLSIRPDYAVDVAGARVGYVELKKPGHGVPGTWSRPSKHDRDQWLQFQLLPNVLYSDGEQFARYTFGKLDGRIGRVAPSLNRAGARLRAIDGDVSGALTSFLLWKPERPRTLDDLVRLVARLCRLLRDDVATEVMREQSGRSPNRTFTALAMDWRHVLFPNLTNAEFADQYAQTITFALLLARVDGVTFENTSIAEIARLLGKKHSFMGRALTVLTDQPEEEHSVALTTMVRVLSVVDWTEFPDDAYAMLYERFLEQYDPKLRRKSGVYYTPAPLVSFMTRFVDEILRKRLDRKLGFAERDVIVVDPAMGTGSFLAAVVDTVGETVRAREGAGAVAPQLRDLSSRLIGFENQAAPYAIAELRIHGLLKKRHRAEVPVRERRFLTDTLHDPNVQSISIGRMYEVLQRSLNDANEIKRSVPVMVVMTNPPYADKVKGLSEWIETASRSNAAPSLSAFRKPGNGRLEYVLANKYVYFWRWATWKAFDAHPADPAGIVAMVCSAGFTTGPGFAGMREYLRRTADEGWIIDLTPEGHQPPMSTRFFRGNQQPICVAIFIRRGNPNREVAARVHRRAVTGSVEEKAVALEGLHVGSGEWEECVDGWDAPFQPAGQDSWESMPALPDLMPWVAPGVKPNRTWVYAPEEATLRERWARLTNASADEKPHLLKETQSTKIDSHVSAVPGMVAHRGPIGAEAEGCPPLRRVAHRPFDRKWVVPDARLHHRPSPSLWLTHSDRQIYVVEQHAHPITSGPALMFTALLPDMHCHSGRGGRVLPLFRDAEATSSNVAPGLLSFLATEIGGVVSPEDLVAYLAGITAHPGFTRRFAQDLVERPGIRIPLTRDRKLWREAVDIGREIVWLQTFGDRFVDSRQGRDTGSPRMRAKRPTVRVRIPDTEAGMPEQVTPDERTQVLHVGTGEIAPVSARVWEYDVNGMQVVKHWFGYRKRNPDGNRSSALNDIVATTWTPTMTTELLDLLNVLGRCVDLEPRQASLLDRIVAGPLTTVEDLTAAGILPVPSAARAAPKPEPQDSLFRGD